MTVICYEPVLKDEDSRRVIVDGEYFTDLRREADGAMFTDIQHPYVNLTKLFVGVSKGPVNFYSSFGVAITIEVL